MITLDHKKMYGLLAEKELLVKEGRKVSSEMETIEFKITKFQDKEKAITGKVEPKELIERGKKIGDEIEAKVKEMDVVVAEIEKIKLDAIPKDMIDAHKALIKEKEQKERLRNKIAMKIQKIKDKVIPIIQKEVKPLLKEYEDIETAKLENGKVVIETFNHLETWKKAFSDKKRK